MRGRWAVVFSSVILLLSFSAVRAQRAEVSITLNEAFFNTFLDSVFTNFGPPEFPIAAVREHNSAAIFRKAAFASDIVSAPCSQTIKILRESGGVRTAARIGNGQINLPLAFSGTYSPPFVGCVEFAGWADTNIELEFDRDSQRLIGRATVAAVNLNGSGGIGSSLIAKMLQGSLDKKLNPIEIVRLDKLSFALPIQNTGNLRLRAAAVTPELSTGLLTLHIEYEFLKG